jgi:hypothetical protein
MGVNCFLQGIFRNRTIRHVYLEHAAARVKTTVVVFPMIRAILEDSPVMTALTGKSDTTGGRSFLEKKSRRCDISVFGRYHSC